MLSRQRSRAPALAALALSSLLLGACAGTGNGGSGGDARKGGSITVAATEAPDSLDPAVSRSPQARQALWLVYTPLLTYRRVEGMGGTMLIPGVAEALPKVSADGTTYTFTLRAGVRYSSGRPVRSGDFEHTVKRALRLGDGRSLLRVIDGAAEYARGEDESADITGITASEAKRRVTVQLTARDPTFLQKVASTYAGIVPSSTPFTDMTRRPPPGVGAYRIAKTTPGREFVLVQRPGFGLGDLREGNVQRIATRVVEDVAAQTDGVVKGRFDYMQGAPPVVRLPEIRSKHKDRYKERATLSTSWLFLNERTPPFDNAQVRKAVNLALDKQALARLYAGRLEPTCNFLPRGVAGFKRIDPCPWGDPGLSGDPEKARALIEESGEKGKRVTVFSGRDRAHRRVARYYVGLLGKIGLKARLKVVRELRGGRRSRAQTGVATYVPELPHPFPFMGRLDGDVLGPDVEERLGQLALQPDVEDAAGDYVELDRLIVENAYAAPYGVERQGTFLSERMDAQNCSRVHPVYGADYSSFCLK